MDRVVDSLVALVSEMSDGQEGAKMTAALHDLLIALMRVDHAQVLALIDHLTQFKHTGDTHVISDGGSVGGTFS